MDNAQERRIRRILRCQGLSLMKSRSRDRAAPDFGGYWILDRWNKRNIAGDSFGMSLNEVVVWIKQKAAPIAVENDKRRTNPDKARERRIRRMLVRLGFTLVKSKRRDPVFSDYGHYWVIDQPYNSCAYGDSVRGMSLDEVEAWAKYYAMKKKAKRSH